MRIPNAVRTALRARVWAEAERLGWDALTNLERSQRYDVWTDDPEVGGVIERYVDKGQVRVYIKDTILKRYAQHRLGDPARVLRVLRIPADAAVAAEYRQPHGRALADGRLVAWGRAEEWRLVLMALHERAFGAPDLRPYGAVLLQAGGRFEGVSAAAGDAARRLGIEQVVWLDD
jgi:hypothetical protein